MAKLNATSVKRFPILVPPIDEQMAICEKLKPVEASIRSLVELRSKLTHQKLGLMQDLLTGKVPVKVHAEAAEATP